MGILEVLTVVFVVLKLVGVITWSWWLVLLPLIIAAVIYVTMYALIIINYVMAKRKIDRAFEDEATNRFL